MINPYNDARGPINGLSFLFSSAETVLANAHERPSCERGKEKSFWLVLEIARPSATCDNLIALPFQMVNSLAAPQLKGNSEAISFLTPFLSTGPNSTGWAITLLRHGASFPSISTLILLKR